MKKDTSYTAKVTYNSEKDISYAVKATTNSERKDPTHDRHRLRHWKCSRRLWS